MNPGEIRSDPFAKSIRIKPYRKMSGQPARGIAKTPAELVATFRKRMPSKNDRIAVY